MDLDPDGYVITDGRSTKPTCPACSRPGTSWTGPTGRQSRPPEQDAAALDAERYLTALHHGDHQTVGADEALLTGAAS